MAASQDGRDGRGVRARSPERATKERERDGSCAHRGDVQAFHGVRIPPRRPVSYSPVRPGANSDRSLPSRNLAQVSGGERELRTYYLKPFERACAAINPAVEGGATALSLMSAYASYDGIPTVANYRE